MASVLVIGAGIGGLVTAGRLAQHGYQVTVVEKNERAGGRNDRVIKEGHHFDTGPTLFDSVPELGILGAELLHAALERDEAVRKDLEI